MSESIAPGTKKKWTSFLQRAAQVRFGGEKRGQNQHTRTLPFSLHNATTLQQILRQDFPSGDVIVVSNRAPFSHCHTATGFELQQPASGLVTALEAVMRACAGIWIAHGNGTADRNTANSYGRLASPHKTGPYTLQRLWLSAEEENGYYQGFSNQGLWPMCHLTPVQPVFREQDWRHYQAVNQRFADAVVEAAVTDCPLVLVQDYHLALCPALIRQRLPGAVIITFWHIPWPQPEALAACPWAGQLMDGLRQSTILGLQTQRDCENFSACHAAYPDRQLHLPDFSDERKQDQHVMYLDSYPISIAWPENKAVSGIDIGMNNVDKEMAQRYNVSPGTRLLLGVDRLDYTKGILERLHAFELLLEQHAEWRGQVVLLQIAAPTRETIEPYQQLKIAIQTLAARINQRFSTYAWQPVNLQLKHHDSTLLGMLYQQCVACVVTSLHDGMNLVAKEFVAAREDEQGVLILSKFTGAAEELRSALIINPYDMQQTSNAMHTALRMPPDEQRQRLRAMRKQVQHANVYRWAERMLRDAFSLQSAALLPE